MATTVTKHESWISRLGNSFRGLVTGFVIFLCSFWLLFWNEGRTVHRHQALQEGAGAVVSLDSPSVDPDNDGKLVHFSGKTAVPGTLTDDVFGVTTNALAMIRTAEMYQWCEETDTEKKTNIGGSEDTITTYTYKKGWFDEPIDSDEFQESEEHVNPPSFPAGLSSRKQLATGVTIGDFAIPDNCIDGMGSRLPFPLPSVTNALPEGSPAGLVRTQEGLYFSWGATNAPAVPKVGDARVKLEFVPPCTASFVARQVGNRLENYHAKKGDIFLQANGTRSAEEMFQTAEKANSFMGNLLRLFGFLMMTAGLKSVLHPLKVLADVLPFLGKIVDFLSGVVAGIICFALSLATIATAWIFYRPVLGISLLVIAAGLVAFAISKKKKAA